MQPQLAWPRKVQIASGDSIRKLIHPASIDLQGCKFRVQTQSLCTQGLVWHGQARVAFLCQLYHGSAEQTHRQLFCFVDVSLLGLCPPLRS